MGDKFSEFDDNFWPSVNAELSGARLGRVLGECHLYFDPLSFLHLQACSQDKFWGGAGPPKCGPFEPKKWTF